MPLSYYLSHCYPFWSEFGSDMFEHKTSQLTRDLSYFYLELYISLLQTAVKFIVCYFDNILLVIH